MIPVRTSDFGRASGSRSMACKPEVPFDHSARVTSSQKQRPNANRHKVTWDTSSGLRYPAGGSTLNCIHQRRFVCVVRACNFERRGQPSRMLKSAKPDVPPCWAELAHSGYPCLPGPSPHTTAAPKHNGFFTQHIVSAGFAKTDFI